MFNDVTTAGATVWAALFAGIFTLLVAVVNVIGGRRGQRSAPAAPPPDDGMGAINRQLQRLEDRLAVAADRETRRDRATHWLLEVIGLVLPDLSPEKRRMVRDAAEDMKRIMREPPPPT